MGKYATVDAYVASLDEPLREISEKVRPVIDAALSDATSAVWHGHPIWDLGPAPGKAPVAFIKAYPKYVTFGLWRGTSITDPSGRLESTTGTMAHVKLRTVDDIDAELFTGWLQQARDLEKAALEG